MSIVETTCILLKFMTVDFVSWFFLLRFLFSIWQFLLYLFYLFLFLYLSSLCTLEESSRLTGSWLLGNPCKTYTYINKKKSSCLAVWQWFFGEHMGSLEKKCPSRSLCLRCEKFQRDISRCIRQPYWLQGGKWSWLPAICLVISFVLYLFFFYWDRISYILCLCLWW